MLKSFFERERFFFFRSKMKRAREAVSTAFDKMDKKYASVLNTTDDETMRAQMGISYMQSMVRETVEHELRMEEYKMEFEKTRAKLDFRRKVITMLDKKGQVDVNQTEMSPENVLQLAGEAKTPEWRILNAFLKQYEGMSAEMLIAVEKDLDTYTKNVELEQVSVTIYIFVCSVLC